MNRGESLSPRLPIPPSPLDFYTAVENLTLLSALP